MSSNKTANILYPTILKCRDCTQDEYWKEIIYNCACNKFPKGIKYNHTKQLMHIKSIASGKTKTEIVTLSQDVSSCYDTLMHVFKTLLGLKSEDDISQSRKSIEDARKNNDVDLDCEWKKLKPKTVKNHILMNFVVKTIDDLNTDLPVKSKHVAKLYRLIQLGIQFKQLMPEDFDYNDGIIHHIKGLKYDEKQKVFLLTNKQAPFPHNSQNKSIKNPLEKSIYKWTKEHKKIDL